MPVVGVPEMVAVPLPLFMKVTPVGRAPDSVRVATGYAVVVTVSLKAAPTMEVAESALVMEGGTSSVRVTDPSAATLVQADSWPS